MARYALINPSNQIDRFASNVDPSVQTKPGWRWLQADPAAPPAFDPETQVREGPAYVVGASDVTENYNVRSLTAQEISDRKDQAVNGINAVIFKLLFNHENRIRANKTPPDPALTAAQFRAAIKAML